MVLVLSNFGSLARSWDAGLPILFAIIGGAFFKLGRCLESEICPSNKCPVLHTEVGYIYP